MPFMIFTEDKYVNDELFAPAHTQVNVDEASVDRWIKRGGKIVGDDDNVYVSVPAQEVFPMTARVLEVRDGVSNILPDQTEKQPEVVAPASPIIRRGPGRPPKKN